MDDYDKLMEFCFEPQDFSTSDEKSIAKEIATIIINSLEDYIINGDSELYPSGFLIKKEK
jgi:hypothetical protein